MGKNNKRLTTEEFIQRAKAVHGEIYDYSKVKYINQKTKVVIICYKHGEFRQLPNNHLKYECSQCANEDISQRYTSNTKSFIVKAKKIYGDKYDYSFTKYTTSRNKVDIYCPKHDLVFSCTANNHLKGSGCPKCGLDTIAEKGTHPIEYYIKKAKKIHKGKYDYSFIKSYKNSVEKVDIKCPIHGIFRQELGVHSSGHGCPKCANTKTRKISNQEFINRAREIHGDKYGYNLMQRTNMHTLITIVCKKHGNISISPWSHLGGTGCPKCKVSSRGEEKIKEFLIKNKIEFKQQVRFKNCKNRTLLPFDFQVFINGAFVLIEYDGEGHFWPIKWSKKMTSIQVKTAFQKVQRNDKIKDSYCDKNHISLIRISYFEFDNIEDILTEVTNG